MRRIYATLGLPLALGLARLLLARTAHAQVVTTIPSSLCDGVHDNSAAIQTIYDFVENAASANPAGSYEIDWPQTGPACVLGSTVTLDIASGATAPLNDVTVKGGAVVWTGTGTPLPPVFKIWDSTHCTIENFHITPGTGTPIGTAFDIKQNQGAPIVSTGNVFINNTVDGLAADGSGLGICFEQTVLGSPPANQANDQMQFYGNWCRFYSTAMFSIDWYTSENDVFLGNFALGGTPTRVPTLTFYSGEAVLDVVGAPFIWKGGQTNANKQDFLLGASTDTPVALNISQMTIEDDGSEASGTFVVVNHGGGTATPQVPVTLKDNTVRTDNLNPQNHCVVDNGPGPLNIEGGSYGLNETPCDFYFNPAAPTRIWGRIVGVAMSGSDSVPVPIESLGTDVIQNDVLVANNVCTGSDGTGTALPCTGQPGVAYVQTAPGTSAAGAVSLNTVSTSGYYLAQEGTFGHVAFNVATPDGTAAVYSVGIYDVLGNRVAHTSPASYGTAGPEDVPFVEGSVPLPPGKYYLADIGSGTTLVLKTASNSGTFQTYAATGTTNGGGLLPATVMPIVPDVPTINGVVLAFYLSP